MTAAGTPVAEVAAAANTRGPGATIQRGLLIVNADDWGRDARTTGRILECAAAGAVSSVSAMVFMEDSDRAASIALTGNIEAGLHLNLTTPFSAPLRPRPLAERQEAVARHLLRHRLAPTVFHPGLMGSFEYVVRTQLDEFQRLYGKPPSRLDGHRHMHLCANVLLSRLLPAGTLVRRNFSFQRGEKGLWNRAYRRGVDHLLARRHRLVDFFFALAPLDGLDRLERIVSLARRFVVEVEAHPVHPDEYRFLTSGEFFRRAGDVRIASASALTGLGATSTSTGLSQPRTP